MSFPFIVTLEFDQQPCLYLQRKPNLMSGAFGSGDYLYSWVKDIGEATIISKQDNSLLFLTEIKRDALSVKMPIDNTSEDATLSVRMLTYGDPAVAMNVHKVKEMA